MSDKAKDHYRIERDDKGEVKIPAALYYGIKTARLKEEWICTGVNISPHLIKAYFYIKQAYAQAHSASNLLEAKMAQAIEQACEEMRSQKGTEQVIADALQSVAGITINTNINEILANRAEEILGGNLGEYKLVKIDEAVNLNQDVDVLFLLATKIAVLTALAELEPEILNLERLLRRDALTLAKVLKVSSSATSQSTTGQWGKRLNVFTTELEIAIKRIKEAENNLLEQKNLQRETFTQAPAKVNKENDAGKLMLQKLETLSAFKLQESDLKIVQEEQSEFVISDLALISSALKDLATVLSKVAGVAKMAHASPPELEKPLHNQVQIYADSLHMSAYQVVSNNFAFTFIAQCEQLESIMLMPLLSFNILSTIELLKAIVLGFQIRGLL